MTRSLSPEDQRIVDNVARYGFHIVQVIEQQGLPAYSFTVGCFQTWQHPDVLVYGLPDRVAGQLLDVVGDRIRAGDRFEEGPEYVGILEGYKCTFRRIPEFQYGEFIGTGLWFYDGHEFPALQLIYPDKAHRWPWEDGATDSFRSHQLVLADRHWSSPPVSRKPPASH